MPTLTNYNQFNGRHWETGTVHNYFAHRGVTAPHTGKPFSEAFLMGVSGGVVMGYFQFGYEGYDPQVNILTRNTFDPFETMLSRLGVIQDITNTAKPEKAVSNLLDVLDEGMPAILLADMWSLPYNALKYDAGMWGSMNILVYGYENDTVYIADRAAVPLTITPDELAIARARIKKIKHRLLTLSPPNPEKLASAVQLGITDCIKLFTEKPPKGSANNFGFNAYQNWAKMLTNPKQRKSWAKMYPTGLDIYAALSSAYTFAIAFGKGTSTDGERGMYADFLDEAATLLNRPALTEAAIHFRASAAAWGQLANALLPADTPLGEVRQLIDQKRRLFIEQGNGSVADRIAIDEKIAGIRQTFANEFHLSDPEITTIYENIATQLLTIHDIEQAAIATMQA